MRKLSRCLWGFVMCLGLLPGVPTADAEVFRRVNGSGVTHYSNLPPSPVLSSAAPPRRGASDLTTMIRSAAFRYGLDPRLVEAVIAVESDFNPLAVSPKGAMGLMQLMPGTAQQYAVDNPFEPLQNILGGTRYLHDLLQRFRGDLRTALAAYNAGEAAVLTYQGVPPYGETRAYVKKVLSRYGEPSLPLSRHAPPAHVYRLPASGGRAVFTNIPPQISLR
jgi:soluble lytic murein transglycosylase-like protein